MKRNEDRRSHLEITPFLVEIEPINFPSQFDERVRVTNFRWAVTLITTPGCFGYHAKICFEGIDKGIYFCKVAHFTGSIVEIEEFEKVDFITRSTIWMRESEKVNKVIKLIEKEIKDNIHIPFAKFGKKSQIHLDDDILRGGDMNCLDWAREKLLLLDIELEESVVKKAIKDKAEEIAALPNFYTRGPDYYLAEPVTVSI